MPESRKFSAAALVQRAKAGNAPKPSVVPQVGLAEMFRGAAREIVELPVDHVRRDESQARQEFDRADLESLAADIKEIGVQEPVKVKHDPERPGRYILVFGERRLRACQLAGVKTIPAIINADSARFREEQLSENFMRADLNPVELATAVAQVMAERGYDTKAMAERYRRPLRQIQRLVEIHEAPLAVKTAMVKGIVVDGERRTLALVLALDTIRAYRHWAREDTTEGGVKAQAQLESLIEQVLREDWSSKRLQQFVGEVGRRFRDPAPTPAPAAPGPSVAPSTPATVLQDVSAAPQRRIEAAPPPTAASPVEEPPAAQRGRGGEPLFELSDGLLSIQLDRARARLPGDRVALKALVQQLESLVAELKAKAAAA